MHADSSNPVLTDQLPLSFKFHRGSVHTISLSSRLGTIIENMPEMSLATLAPNFCAGHEEDREIRHFGYSVGKWFVE